MRDGHSIEQPSMGRKTAISIALGLLCVAGTFRTISASFPPHEVTIVWSLFLPMLVALAWGWRYAIVSATLGGAALFPFLLWPSNGWANESNASTKPRGILWWGKTNENLRRKTSDDRGCRPGDHGGDRALLAELALCGRFVQVGEPLLSVRDHARR
jgi:hypothetical protein